MSSSILSEHQAEIASTELGTKVIIAHFLKNNAILL
jgi:hypothetical protein